MCVDFEYKFDIISCLPEELIGELAKYLDGGDILICSLVSPQWKMRMDQENVWRILCVERGWLLNDVKNDITSWRNLYWLNQNWCKGLYTFYKFSDEDIHPQSYFFPNFDTAFADFTSLDSDGEFLILPRRDGINIWDVSNDAKIHQRILNNVCTYCSQFDTKVNKQFIIYITGNYLQIYKKNINSKMYERDNILHLEYREAKEMIHEQVSDINSEHELDHKAEVSENYLAVVQENEILFIWFLKPWEFITSVEIVEPGIKVIDIKINCNNVFLLQINANKFHIRSYDVKNKLWTLDLYTDDCDTILDNVHPRLFVSKSLIASLSPCNTTSTALNVWDFHGRILKSTFLPKETYTQCCVVNDMVIYRSSKNTISLWSSKTDSIIKELDIKGSFSFIEECPGDLLLVARGDDSQIWDWKKGNQLYTIKEKTHLCYTRLLNNCFYATLVMDMNTDTMDIFPHIQVFYFGTNIIRG